MRPQGKNPPRRPGDTEIGGRPHWAVVGPRPARRTDRKSHTNKFDLPVPTLFSVRFPVGSAPAVSSRQPAPDHRVLLLASFCVFLLRPASVSSCPRGDLSVIIAISPGLVFVSRLMASSHPSAPSKPTPCSSGVRQSDRGCCAWWNSDQPSDLSDQPGEK